MVARYRLKPQLRKKLKRPLGTLFDGPPDRNAEKIKQVTSSESSPMLISVGDEVSRSLLRNNIPVNLYIVDNRTMREQVKPFEAETDRTFHVKNPAGTITDQSIRAIQKALSEEEGSTKIIVDGEEDLLALAAVIYAPDNSFVVYGQPKEGAVLIRVTEQKKRELGSILKAMESSRKAK